MGKIRDIRPEEKLLVQSLLKRLGATEAQYPIANIVDEYEDGIMGSISFCTDGSVQYAADLIQVEYTDTDGTNVVITLTRDINKKLLDLDFWKEDFSKLLQYPKPEDIK